MTAVSPPPGSPLPDASSPGFAPPASATVVLDVVGMKCAGCVRAVETRLTQVEGVQSATVNLVTEVAVAAIDPQATSAPALAEAVAQAGFQATPRATDTPTTGLSEWAARQEAAQQHQGRQLALALGLLALSTLGHLKHLGWLTLPVLSSLWFHGLLATLTLVVPARPILVDGWHGLRRLAPTMNSLVALGSLSAYLASLVALVAPQLGWECFFDEPVMLLSFILLGRTLEQRARFRAADSLRALVALQPTVARLIPTATSTAQVGVEVPIGYVQVGEWLQVRPGEKIPADGTVVTGTTTVNESMLTGESAPVTKQPGNRVVAGTLNQDGTIALAVTSTGEATTLAQMIRLVETAQSRKAPVQRLADVVAGYFTYGILAAAALTVGFWYWVGLPLWPEVMAMVHSTTHSMTHSGAPALADPAMAASQVAAQSVRLLVSLKLGIAVLVVACPCALGLATPTAILVGSGLGAERGLLLRGGDILEALHRVDHIAFDKTGTLTQGQPAVAQIVPLAPEPDLDPLDNTALLQLAATVESGATHPLATAIQQAAQTRSLDLLSATDFTSQPGLGAAATVSWAGEMAPCWVGNRPWLAQQGIAVDGATEAHAETLAAAGQTVVYIALNQSVVGLLGVADVLRPEAASTLAALQAQGISVHMLTGDRQTVAQGVAQQIGLTADQITAEVSPQGKLTAIQQWQAQGQVVAVVGDGINDAPALAQADVGVALHSGTDVAIETADVILMANTLSGLLTSLRLSHATFRTVRQNLTWAFGYNLMAIPLAAGGLLPTTGIHLSPAAAGALMAFSSVTVVVNSLLLGRRL